MKISFELGGNAPFIVFDDADLEVAVKALINTKFRNAGQACIASNRVLVHEKIYDEFASMLVKKVSKMEYGDGMDRNIAIGRLHPSLFYLSFFFYFCWDLYPKRRYLHLRFILSIKSSRTVSVLNRIYCFVCI